MGLADRDYMHARHRGASVHRVRASSDPNWKVAVFIVLALVGAAWLAYRMLGPLSGLPFPPTGQAHWYVTQPTRGTGTAPLTITAPSQPQRNYVVKLSEKNSSRSVALIPIRPGEEATLQVPLGEYQVTLASGKSWQGPEKLFGATGDVQVAVEPMHFYRSGNQQIGHRIDLAQRMDGNMRTRAVNPWERF